MMRGDLLVEGMSQRFNLIGAIIFFAIDIKRWRTIHPAQDAAFKVGFHYFQQNGVSQVCFKAETIQLELFCQTEQH